MSTTPDPNLDPNTVDPDYIVASQLAIVFSSAQEVVLDRAAHTSSIVVSLIPELDPPETLTLGVDYTLTSSDYDYMAMSRAVLWASAHSLTFTGLLAKSIRMIRSTVESYRINVSYTTLEVDLATYLPGGEGPEATPGLMKEMIERIQSLESGFNPVTDIATELLSGIRCLAEDLTGTSIDNWIDDERHYVNTLHSEQVIRCSAGSIYRNGLILYKEADPLHTPLVEGTDYVLFGVDHARTKASYNPSGVYDYICVTQRAIAGVIVVQYHAYGGQFTDLDGYAMKQAFANLLRYLRSIGFGVGGSGGVCATLGEISSLHSVTAADAGYHWLTIAKLYRDPSLVYLNKGAGIFRVHGIDALKFDVTFSVDWDVERTTSPLKTELISGLNPINWTAETYDADVVNQIIPQIRCIWVEGSETGVYLQFGFPIRVGGAQSVAVENYSTTASYWTILDGGIFTHGTQDDSVVLPNGTTTWLTASHQQVQRILGYKDGTVLFSGYFEMVNNVEEFADMSIYSPLLGTDIPLWAVSTLEFTIYDRYDGYSIKHKLTRNPGLVVDGSGVAMSTLFYPRDLCGFGTYTYVDIGNNLLVMLIQSWMGSHSLGAGMTTNPVPRFAITAIKAIF